MDLAVTIFERKREGQIEWHTVGLGALDFAERGRNLRKLEQRTLEGLRKRIEKLWPEQLEALEFVRGRRLEFVTLELSLASSGARRRIHGAFPVVLEPRPRGPSLRRSPLWRVFHPLRPSEWFVHEESRTLVEEATAFFRERWAELADDDLETLRATVKSGAKDSARALDRLRLVSYRVFPKTLDDRRKQAEEAERDKATVGSSRRGKRQGDGVLAELGVNQTMRAIDGALDPGVIRKPYREQLRQLVCGDRRRSVLVVGPSGVGKTTLLARLVHDRLEADAYAIHRNLGRVRAVWQIRGRRIIAGMSYLGQWEQRCVDLLETAIDRRAILWIDDVHAWGRIGESAESERSLATFFRGPIARGELTVIGECTPEQLQQLRDDAPAFASAFTALHVEPTSEVETIRLIVHEARALEQRTYVAFDPRTFRTVYELGSVLGSGSAHPGRALDLLRGLSSGEQAVTARLGGAESSARAGKKIQAIKEYRSITGQGLKASKEAVEAYMRTGYWPHDNVGDRPPIDLMSARARHGQYHTIGPPELGPASVVNMLARRTGMPEVLLAADQQLDGDFVQRRFAGQIMGQPAAVAAARDLVLRIKAGLIDPGRPYGVFLFTGPTGTGKTEMAKCVAEYLYGDQARLLRFDMSEYNGPTAAARLIGDRYQPIGTLTGQVRAQPFSVVLLDEVEKADPEVLNLMLQLFDDGRLTDATGTVVDFTHTVVIMTSNLGSRRGSSIGFGDELSDLTRDVDAAVREFFPPELFNRIDHVIQFGPLSREAAYSIARRELKRLLDRHGLTERNVFVRFTPAVVDMIVREGFHARDGARSLKRFLEDRVGARLAEDIAGAGVAAVRVFWLYMRDGALMVHGEHLVEAEARGIDPRIEDLVEWNMGRLRLEIPRALAEADALLVSDASARLASALSESLDKFRARADQEQGRVVYTLETLRGELQALRERLATQLEYDPALSHAMELEDRVEAEAEIIEATAFPRWPKVIPRRDWDGEVIFLRGMDLRQIGPALPMKTRPAIIEHVASLLFLERALARAEDPDEHVVILELSRISRSRGANRFAADEPGLLEWLAEAYAQHGQGEVDERAVAELAGDDATVSRYQPERYHRAFEQVTLRIIGPSVRTFFRGEHGCHVRHSVSGTSEVVRVRVLPGRERSAEAHLRGIAEARRAFEEWLEGGSDGRAPDNPDEILPILRRYHFDLPSAGVQAPIVVEDYVLAHATETRVRQLGDALPTLWILRLGAERGAEEG